MGVGDARRKVRDRGRPFMLPVLAGAGDRYMVADCGGGTVDLTVHQLEQPHGTLKELYKASGEYTHEYPVTKLTGPSIVPWWPIWQ